MFRGICQNELFNLKEDPGELYNLWNNMAFADIRNNLVERLAELEINAIDRVPLPTAQA